MTESIGQRVARQLKEGLAKKRALAQAGAEAQAARRSRTKLVSDQGQIVGRAAVHLSPSDPNWRGSGSQYVLIREDLAEAQRADREAYRRYLRELDPCRDCTARLTTTMLREDQVMNEVVRPVATTEDEAVAWIAQALDEGDFAKEADSYRLVKRFGLDLEPISTAWDEKRRDAKARLAADRARLTNLSARVAKVKPTSFILPKDRNKYLGARPPEPQPAENRGPAGEGAFGLGG